MTPLRSSLEADLRAGIRAELPPATEAIDELVGGALHDLLHVYCNWAMRLVPVRPRAVHTSPQFDDDRKRVGTREETSLQAILSDIAAGANLRRYLSERVQTAHSDTHPHRPLRHREHLDLLLFGWGIHHLHVSTSKKRGGGPFVARSDTLLLAMFKPSDAYIIALRPHDEAFDDVDLLRIAVRAWPDAELALASRTAVGLAADTTESAAELRNAGVATLLEIDGTVYLPRTMGVTTAGTSLEAGRQAMRVAAFLDAVERDETVGRDAMHDLTGVSAADHTWRVVVSSGEFFLVADDAYAFAIA